MTYKKRLKKILNELLLQINILKNYFNDNFQGEELNNKIDDLIAYKKRMIQGIEFLNNLKDKNLLKNIEEISSPSFDLMLDNKERYLNSLKNYRLRNNIELKNSKIQELIFQLKKISLIHKTNDFTSILKTGIKSSSSLWLTNKKSCANAMDIALNLNKYIFLTHGFTLDNFTGENVFINNSIIDNEKTMVSSMDLFTFVLIKTKKSMPCSVKTYEWIDVLGEYKKNIFSGKDFWELKSNYILTFFDSLEEYNIFARNNFYSNFVSKSTENEYPFFGEIKVFNHIDSSLILQ